MRNLWITALTATILLLCSPPGLAAATRPVTVYAAASLSDALRQIAATYTQRTRTPVQLSLAASSALARQLEAGSPADLFFCADESWMDYAAKRGLTDPASRRDVVGNELVLIAPVDSPISLRLNGKAGLAAALGGGRLAIADPDSVPAGQYAKRALLHLGQWQELQLHLVRADNVRGALRFVALGEAPLGIVYASDALSDARVKVVDTFAADTHPPIVYPLALLPDASNEAKDFYGFLMGPQARAIFQRWGFKPLN